jgi:glycosyltransferase involved in cell wall biosynthesis
MSAWGSDILVTPKRNKLYRAVTKFALNSADIITSDSDYMTQEIKKLTKTQAVTVPMGVERELCSMERKSPGDEIVLLSLRTIDSNSNIDVIIKAFNKLIEKYPDRKIKLIVGNTGPDLEKIRALVNEMNLREKVIVRGFIKREELLRLLSSCTAYLSVPTSDSTSVTLLEAMAFGTPCIVSDLPANREWIIDGENGIIIDSISSTVLCDGMERIIKDEVLVKRCEKECREEILKRAIWDDNMAMVEKEYKKLLAGNDKK